MSGLRLDHLTAVAEARVNALSDVADKLTSWLDKQSVRIDNRAKSGLSSKESGQ